MLIQAVFFVYDNFFGCYNKMAGIRRMKGRNYEHQTSTHADLLDRACSTLPGAIANWLHGYIIRFTFFSTITAVDL